MSFPPLIISQKEVVIRAMQEAIDESRSVPMEIYNSVKHGLNGNVPMCRAYAELFVKNRSNKDGKKYSQQTSTEQFASMVSELLNGNGTPATLD